jgi:SAM-dependent methyltransferase
MLPAETPYIRRHFQTLVRECGFSPGRRVLEIGAGMGRFSRLFGESGIEVVATDISPEQIDELGRRFPSIRAEVAGADNLSADLGQFDAVVGFFVLHHLPNLNQACQAFHQRLKPGGVVAFCEPQGLYFPFYLQVLLTPRMRWSVERGIVDMRESVLSPILQEAGFADLAYHYYGHFPPLLYNSATGRSAERILEKLPLPLWARAFQIVQGRLGRD